MMKNNKIQDERILLERRKIQSTSYGWIVILLLVSIVVQQFFMSAPFAQYAAELLILLGCGFFNIISNFRKGIDIWNPAGNGKKKLLLYTIVSGIASVTLLAFLSGNYDVKNLALYFVTFVIFLFTFRSIMIGINSKKQQAIDQKLNEEEKRE